MGLQVHVWEVDGVMSAHSGVNKDTPHATPGLRSAPPFWSSEPTDSGRVELLLEEMERCGVDGAVLVQMSFSTWNNEYVAAAALRFPSRCRSMGMVDPLDPEAVKHAIYWMDHRGMSGFRFHPSYCPSHGSVWRCLTLRSNLPSPRACSRSYRSRFCTPRDGSKYPRQW